MAKSQSKKSSLAERLKASLKDRPKLTFTLRPSILCCPNTPKPMHGVVPREILGPTWWKKTREAAFKSTGYHCHACGIHRSVAAYHTWLEGHEIYSADYLLGRWEYVETVGICHFCHNYIHDGRLKSLLDKGQVHFAKYAAILQHGDTILRDNRLERPRYAGEFADWGDWRLILDGREYPPKFKTFEEWAKFHG